MLFEGAGAAPVAAPRMAVWAGCGCGGLSLTGWVLACVCSLFLFPPAPRSISKSDRALGVLEEHRFTTEGARFHNHAVRRTTVGDERFSKAQIFPVLNKAMTE